MSRWAVLPVKIVLWPLGLVWRGVGYAARPVVSQVDSSSRLSNLINELSSSMATQRGLLLMMGTGLLIVSLIVHLVVVVLLVSTRSFDQNLYWLCIPFALLHLGVLTGFTGAMLATPLGQGYKDK
jgi:hypothetical protein